MISILHLIPTLGFGGAERQLSFLARQQLKYGFDVNIGVRQGGEYEPELINKGIQVHKLGNWRGPNPLLINNLLRLIKRIKPDIIQTWLPQMDIIGGVITCFTHIPWIMTERSIKAAYSDFPFQAFLRRLGGLKATKIIANSNAGAKYWEDNLSNNEKISMIENGIDVDLIMNSSHLSLSLNYYKNPLILMVGSLVKSKKHEVLLKAVKLVLEKEKIDILIIGDGNQKSLIINLIKRLNLQDYVTLKSYDPEWFRYLKFASMFVSPSVIEGQPNVVLEAMAAKCPLIVSDIPAHRQILDDKSALIIPQNNINEFANAILSLLENRELGLQRAKKAFLRLKKMSVESIASKYKEVYLDILK